MIRLLSTVAFFAANPLIAGDLPALFAVTGVASSDVLNIRQSPDPIAPIIGSFPPDATGIEVVAMQDDWASVNTAEGSGFVAAKFLRPEGGPPWYRLEAPLTCFGTEPFWSLSIAAGTRSVVFRSAEAEQDRELAVNEIWPGEAWSKVAALSTDYGMAVLRPALCGDGMSEARYGIAIDLLLNGGGHRISGCCSIAPQDPGG